MQSCPVMFFPLKPASGEGASAWSRPYEARRRRNQMWCRPLLQIHFLVSYKEACFKEACFFETGFFGFKEASFDNSSAVLRDWLLTDVCRSWSTKLLYLTMLISFKSLKVMAPYMQSLFKVLSCTSHLRFVLNSNHIIAQIMSTNVLCEEKKTKKTYHFQGGRSPHHRLLWPPDRHLTLNHPSASHHPKTYHRSPRGWLWFGPIVFS